MRKAGSMKVSIVVVLCATLMWTACSTAWTKEAEQIVAALIPATANLMALVTALRGSTVSEADLQTIQSAGAQAGADLQLIQSLITEYEKADAAAQPGLLDQIEAAMSAVQSNLNGLLPALHIKDAATQAKVSAIVGVLVSEAESLAAIVPLMQAGVSPEMKGTAAKQIWKRPPLTASQFVVSYNATMTAKTGHAELDRATAALRIHVHNKLERWASAGLLK